MLKEGLDPSGFLQWHSVYDVVAETKTQTNLQFGLNITQDMLTSYRQYTDPVSQSKTGLNANFQQVSDLTFKPSNFVCPRTVQSCTTGCEIISRIFDMC